jgi:protein phosphatase
MATKTQIEAVLRTDVGQLRDHNEDYVSSREPADAEDEAKNGWLYIVADGVGGAEAGEVASRFATEQTIKHFLARHAEHDWGKRLREAVLAANADLRQMVVERESNMATTMVATVIHDGQVTMTNVGDSRGYHWRDGTLHQITRDQSLVAKLVEEGAITEEEAINHPRKNVILHSLGSKQAPQIDVFDVPLEPGDLLLLCSDGLVRHVRDEEINEVITEKGPAEASETLIDLANDRGGEDNISVGILRYEPAKAKERASTATTQKVIRPKTVARPTVPSRPVPAAPAAAAVPVESGSRALMLYTAFLAIVQIVAIVLIWLALRV